MHADFPGMRADDVQELPGLTGTVTLLSSERRTLETVGEEAESLGSGRGRTGAPSAHRPSFGPPSEVSARGVQSSGGRLACVRGRDHLVRVRLGNLLAVLGGLRSQPSSLRVHERGHTLARLLEEGISRGAVLLSGRYLPNEAVPLGCLVVAPRGVVVVDIAPGRQCAGRARGTLTRAYALRSWLAGTDWSGVPVLAAVCSLEGPEAAGAAPVVLDRLWLGTTGCLGSWLMGGGPLDIPVCRALGAFLEAQLPG